MRSGIAWREWPYDAKSDVFRMARSGDWVRFVLDRPMQDAPGTRFHYSGGTAHLLSAAIGQATGQAAADYARVRLFSPLGIARWEWRTDPQGRSIGESGLSLAPGDLARIGLLVLRDGRWKEQRLLPEGWLRSVLAQARPHGLQESWGLPPRFARMWWVDEKLPMAATLGRHGQYLVLLPRHDVVLVITSRSSDRPEAALRIGDVVAGPLLAALRSPTALAPDPEGSAVLRATLERLAQPPPLGAAPVASTTVLAGARATADEISGRRYRLTSNRQGVAELAVIFDAPGQGRLVMAWHDSSHPEGRRSFERPFGTDGRFRETGPTPWGVFASRGAWLDARTLLIESVRLQGSTVSGIRVVFDDRDVRVTLTETDAQALEIKGRAIRP